MISKSKTDREFCNCHDDTCNIVTELWGYPEIYLAMCTEKKILIYDLNITWQFKIQLMFVENVLSAVSNSSSAFGEDDDDFQQPGSFRTPGNLKQVKILKTTFNLTIVNSIYIYVLSKWHHDSVTTVWCIL